MKPEEEIEVGLTEDPSIVDEDMYGAERFYGLVHDGFTLGHAPCCGDRLTARYESSKNTKGSAYACTRLSRARDEELASLDLVDDLLGGFL
jgi:hypothetical protein